jgi:hypothetical protein
MNRIDQSCTNARTFSPPVQVVRLTSHQDAETVVAHRELAPFRACACTEHAGKNEHKEQSGGMPTCRAKR